MKSIVIPVLLFVFTGVIRNYVIVHEDINTRKMTEIKGCGHCIGEDTINSHNPFQEWT
ncbi:MULTISPECIES: hypothetical protein [unclassified Oceanispirochaeta]|uniref:hypothetical protein n=1 Tax=unclassified Oceanispirochaeta TaxID=2635722 RepID=UPI0014950CB0|nr:MULTISPECIES: hypothetical protein [unclassified Oceanispirochaeta]MBF9018824.1 hypothetical protein [Oceanispirochaeta sp. M2]NPD75293.1 hypothetical protein [Oceanispirochaeta sp. M1]